MLCLKQATEFTFLVDKGRLFQSLEADTAKCAFTFGFSFRFRSNSVEISVSCIPFVNPIARLILPP